MSSTLENARLNSGLIAAAAISVALSAPATAQVAIPFVIDRGELQPQNTYAVEVKVLGAAIGYGSHGGYDAMVTLQVTIEESDGTVHTFDPFGPFDEPVNGNINNGVQQREVIFVLDAPNSNRKIA